MADNNIEKMMDAADLLKINYMTLYKIMDGSSPPQVPHCMIILEKGKFSANWLFLNKGAKDLGQVVTMEKIYKKVSEL